MPDLPISKLPVATTLHNTDQFVIDQNCQAPVTRRVSLLDLLNYIFPPPGAAGHILISDGTKWVSGPNSCSPLGIIISGAAAGSSSSYPTIGTSAGACFIYLVDEDLWIVAGGIWGIDDEFIHDAYIRLYNNQGTLLSEILSWHQVWHGVEPNQYTNDLCPSDIKVGLNGLIYVSSFYSHHGAHTESPDPGYFIFELVTPLVDPQSTSYLTYQGPGPSYAIDTHWVSLIRNDATEEMILVGINTTTAVVTSVAFSDAP